MIIRKATPSDVNALSALAMETYSVAFGHSFSPADLAFHLENNLAPKNMQQFLDEDILFVAEDHNCIIGFVQFGRTRTCDDTGSNDQELRRLYVHPDFQNKGIGSLLMDAALDHPSLKEADNIFLDVWEHNHGAQRFYARYGFKVIGQRKFLVQSGAETSLDLIMVRRRSAYERPQ